MCDTLKQTRCEGLFTFNYESFQKCVIILPLLKSVCSARNEKKVLTQLFTYWWDHFSPILGQSEKVVKRPEFLLHHPSSGLEVHLAIYLFSPPIAFITDSLTNKRLLSDRFVTLIQGRNVRTASSTPPAAYLRLSLHSQDDGKRRERSGWKGKTEKSLREMGKRNGQSWWGVEGGRRRHHSIVSAEGTRYEYSNFTLLIRDGCRSLFLWGGKRCLCLFPA